MKQRPDWLAEAVQRQRNIDPIQRIPNAARFQGELIKGDRKLTPFQRVAAVSLGMLSLLVACVMIAQLVRKILHPTSISDTVEPLVFGASGVVSLYFSFRITLNAVINEPSTKKTPLGLKKKIRK